MTTVRKVGDKLKEVFEAETRKTVLDIKPHFVPLNPDALRVFLGAVINTSQEDVEAEEYGRFVSIESLQQELVTYVTKRHKNKLYINALPQDLLTNIENYTPAVVYNSSSTIVGVLYNSYNKAYEGLFRGFVRDKITPYLKNSRYSKSGTAIQKGFDVGHIIIDGVAATPLLLKLQNLLKEIDNQLGSNPQAVLAIKQKVQEQEKKLREKSRYGREINSTFEKDTTDFLGVINANVVIIQDRLENQYFYGNQIEGVIEREVSGLLKTMNFSRNLEEDMVYRLVSTLDGVKVGRMRATAKQKTKIASNVKIKAGVVAKNKTAKPVKKIEIPNINVIPSLQAILDSMLHEQIKKNMGTGTSKSVLNYRTGRLAKSAKVERFSESRQGMLTIFYSYMKYPYATFSSGGRQEYPKSRDPKLLISKSIRELASSMVGNRLRAVNI